MKFPKLHTQILIALVIGVIAGILVKKPADMIDMVQMTQNELHTFSLEEWQSISVHFTDNDKPDSLTAQNTEAASFLQRVKSVLKTHKSVTVKVVYADTKIRVFENVTALKKPETFANSVKWMGDLFIRLLNMIAIPLVISTLIVGVSSLGDIRKFTKVGSKTIAIYMSTTAIAITLGLVLANTIKPGEQLDSNVRDQLIAEYSTDAAEKFAVQAPSNFIDDFLLPLVPKNIFVSLTDGNMLQIVFFAVFVGIVLNIVKKEQGEPVIKFFSGISDIMITMVDLVMMIAPLGVFALIMFTVADLGYEILYILFWYGMTVIFGLLLQAFGVYALLLKLFTKVNIRDFYRSIREPQTIAFTTSSSAATLPVSMQCAEEDLGISKSVSGFVLPLGATINMDGTALYQGVAAIFIAQVFGLDLSLTQQLTIVLMATLASVGTAPVPGVGILMLVIILKSVHIPEIGIALILGIDRILDMCRTVTNVTGDLTTATLVASLENEKIVPNPD